MSSSENDSDNDTFDFQFGSVDIEEFNYRVNIGTKLCSCVEPIDGETVLGIFNDIIDNLFLVENVNCTLNSIIACCNYALKFFINLEDPYRLAFADQYYRMRHEILCKLLMKTLNLPETKSDTPFSSLGIESERTPDYISVNGSDVLVIEVATTSNFEKTAMMKGLSSSGYESKYSREIEMLRDKNYMVHYLVIIFDMSSYDISNYMTEINKLGDKLFINNYFLSYLNLVYKEFCTITYNMKDYLYPVSSFLFTDIIPIEPNHKELEFLYTQKPFLPNYKYKKFVISSQVYSKISNIWYRILNIYEYCNKDFTGKYNPVLSLTNNRLHFEESSEGFLYEEVRDIILNNNKPAFFNKLLLCVGNTKFPAMGSETGIEFTEKIYVETQSIIDNYEMPFILDHHKVPVKKTFTDISKYELILNKVFNSNFASNYFDPLYEDLYIEKIYDMDLRMSNETLNPETYKVNLGLGLLQENDLNKLDINSKLGSMLKTYIDNNDFNESIPLKIKRMKQSFILPLANFSSKDYSKLDYKNTPLFSHLYRVIEGNEFTKSIIMKLLDKDFSFYCDKVQPSHDYLDQQKKKYELSNKMTQLYKKYISTLSLEKRKNCKKLRLIDCEDMEIKNDYLNLKNLISKITKDLDKIAKNEGIKQNIEFIRLPTKNKKSILNSFFKKETEHFKSKEHKLQSTIEGYGLPSNINQEYERLRDKLNDLGDNLTNYRGDNPDLLIDLNTYDDSCLLRDLKAESLNKTNNLINDIKNSYLGHACSFVSRMSHSLMFYSQMPFNSDYIRVDNLGYNNVLLIVRGGKKIFKSKSSKMFRIMFPVSSDVVEFYVDDIVGPSNYIHFKFQEEDFLLSPWMMLHESILTDSISFYPRVISFCVLNSDPSLDFKRQVHKYLLNIYLAFHNRRQSEVFLANMRYILLSTMGDFTGIMDIFEDFCGFNYDKFQFYIRSSIFLRYNEFFSKMRIVQSDERSSESKFRQIGVKNIFTNKIIENTDSLTLMIYSTFLMTKGPYQRPAERAINLLGMLKINELFDKKVGLKLGPEDQLNKISVFLKPGDTFEQYCKDLFNNDFIIDPKYISCLGVFANSYFENLNLKDKFQIEWLKILNKEWDSMATSTGLRGKPSEVEDFWGKKGYFVVYKFLLKAPGYKEEMDKMLSINVDDNEKQKILRKLNQTYLSKIDIEKNTSLLFHAVDKVQWRGSREIFVMDLDTKLMQQPIERMMAYLCKNIDNELISIPTDKRAQIIHHTIFEKDLPLKDALTWFLTLDCSKWAPKSMFIKFCIMLTSMPILPPSFVCHFLNYSEKLFYKRIYFNNSEVKVLENNHVYKKIINEYLIKDEKLDGYYMLMPYSWVMGIFNYTSSFMHAFNQKYAAYLINKTSRDNFGEETSMVMFAHSDDSGGRITSISKNLIERGLMLYEIQLKSCNHLLSKKKSVVSKIYFEILSIIYLFKKLLALLPKFLGGLRFTPTDKGPCHDMLQSYSKSIEVMVAGADFQTAYLVMKFYSMLIWRFYYNKKPLEIDYQRPVQYFGIPDAHPLMVLLTGSDSDILRLMATKQSNKLFIIHSLMKEINSNFDDEGMIRPLKFNIKVRNIQKGFDQYIEYFNESLKSWTIGNINFKKSPFNALNFLKKLNDPGFVGSLVNETPVRRISRAYFLRTGPSIIAKEKVYTLNEVMTATRVTSNFLNGDKTVDLTFIKNMLSEEFLKMLQINNDNIKETPIIKVMSNVLAGPLKLHKYFDKLSLKDKEYRTVSRTLKPTQLQLLKVGSSFSSNFDASQLVSYIKEPNFRWALPDLKNLSTAQMELEKLLFTLDLKIDDLDESTLLKLIRMHVTKTLKDIYLYSQIPGEIRTIKTYASMLIFLSTNSFKNIEIGGLALKLKSSLTDPGYIESTINEDIYYLNTLCSIIIMIIKGKYEFNLSELRIKEIDFINWKGGDMLNFIYYIESKKYMMPDFIYIQLYIDYISKYILNPGEISSSILIDKAYYVFLKEQKRRGGWYGSGQLLICVGKKFFILNLMGNNINSIESNMKGKLDQTLSAFIIETCVTCGINISSNYMLNNNKIGTNIAFGYDHVNELNITEKREINKGIPFHYLKRNPLFINQLDFGTIEHLRENIFICNINVNEEFRSYKIYGLKINKTNISDTIQSLFCSEDFHKVMVKEGIDNLTEFIMTELLSQYGEDVTINRNEFFDLIFSSEIYKVFTEVKRTNSHYLPKIIKTAKIPAEEGSLQRIMLSYGETTNQDIIKNYKNYDANMLAIRSEYPENFSLILSEKMIESYKKLFSSDEENEIINSYIEISKIENKEILRKKLISLMCYWGHGSLVNAINLYDFKKKKNNYSLIRITDVKNTNKPFYSELFVKITQCIIDSMLDLATYYNQLEFPVKGLVQNKNLLSILKQYLKFLALSGYDYKNPINFYDLSNIYFINTLLAFLKFPEFCEILTARFSKNPPLNTLPIDYTNRKEFIALLNTLKVIFFQNLDIKYNLNYDVIIDRLPPGITQPSTIAGKFNKDILKPKEMTYHHGFLNNYIIDKLKSKIKLQSGNKTYTIHQKINSLSDTKVNAIKELPLIRPLNEEFLNSEIWDEINQEMSFGDIDFDTIQEMFSEYDEDPYKKRETHFKKNKVEMDLNWVILPYLEGKSNFFNKIRQVGENIAIITNSVFDFTFLPNSYKFLTNFSDLAGGDLPDVTIYVTGNKSLKRQFWKDLLGENEFVLQQEQLDPLFLNLVNTEVGISNTDCLGAISSNILLTESVENLEKEIYNRMKEDEEVQITESKDKKEKEEGANIDKINNEINKALSEGLIDNKIADKLKTKYISYSTQPGLKISDILSSLLEEIDINMLGNMFLNTLDFGLSKSQLVKIYQTPEHFGLSQSADRSDKNPILNSKLRAELESFCIGLSSKIASGSLTISKEMYKLVKSSFKIWKTFVLATSYKKENKKFLLKIMNSIINSAFTVDDDADDFIWNTLVTNVQVLIAQDEEDEESSDDENYINFDYNIAQSARLKYRFSGFQ